MIEHRNLSSHTYNQEVASSIVAAVRDRYYPASLALEARLKGEL